MEAVVWRVETDLEPARFVSLVTTLDEVERTRAARFVAEEDRNAYVASHAALRDVVASLLGVRCRDVVFDRTCSHCGEPHGRPRVVGASFDVGLSHSRGRALVAVATGGAVGVDIEPDNRPIGDVVDMVLAPAERERHDALRPEDRDRFLRLTWTYKEAYLKATGEGLRRDLRTVVLDGTLSERPVVRSAADWWLSLVAAGAGYTAAVALDGAPRSFQVLDWSR